MQQEIWFQKYKILDLLGRGGNAEVYLAEHIKLNSLRAIKFISKNHPLYDLQCKEALILKNLKHSCIPIIYDIEENEDGSYIVEQYIEGETLKNYVLANGPFSEETVIHLALQLCDLIRYLHSAERPVLYIDLKPDNIILSGRTLKLIDFGSAIYRDELSPKQGYCGTRGYAAPELYQKDIIDERCDVYGIGMLLYFMATGQDVKDDSLGIANIDDFGTCSKQLKRIINHCLKYNSSQRFATVNGLSRHLSAMIKRNQFQTELNKSVRIAIAGAGPRMGVTHLAFRLCKYFTGLGFPCLCEEHNSSGCIYSMKSCYEHVDIRDGICRMNGIYMLPWNQGIRPDTGNYKVTVLDFGCLTEYNLQEFMNSEVKLLILGAKDWELALSEQAIHLTAEYKDITYLFNFINGRQFQQVMKSMQHKVSFRIPYEPDPFAAVSQKNDLAFFQELFRPFQKLTPAKRAAALWKRRKGSDETKTNII